MARHLRGDITAEILAQVNRRHITTEKLDAANRDIINRFRRCTLPRCWGDEKRAAADGTQYDLAEENLVSERHIRYGGFGGIIYHHISDMYIALFSHFLACSVFEAIYIIDGLLKNTSELRPDTVHADTQGQNLPVFALSYLLRIKLMPRIRNWKDLKFYRSSKETTYQHIDALFVDNVVDWELIKTHWQDLLRVVISIQEGKVLPSMLLRKLDPLSIFSDKRSVLIASFSQHHVDASILAQNKMPPVPGRAGARNASWDRDPSIVVPTPQRGDRMPRLRWHHNDRADRPVPGHRQPGGCSGNEVPGKHSYRKASLPPLFLSMAAPGLLYVFHSLSCVSTDTLSIPPPRSAEIVSLPCKRLPQENPLPAFIPLLL